VHLAPEVKAMQAELSSSLGAPVEISKNANNGKITITFFRRRAQEYFGKIEERRRRSVLIASYIKR